MSSGKIQVVSGNVRLVAVSSLKPHPNNPREHTEDQVDLIVSAIRKFGFAVPVLVDEDNMILSGHGRVQAAKKLKMRRVPVINVSNLTDEQKKAFLIADNKLTERGGWNDEALGSLVVELHSSGFDLGVLGLDPPQVHGYLSGERTGFLEGENGQDEDEGEERGTITRVSEFVQLNFTLTGDQRKMIMNVLKREAARRGLQTSAEALVALCQEVEDGQQD